ncbi:hypothetical protein [Helicobacter marmotae]|uniref:hypothetical protein n=1 Tax=Helicobacter marmotae TaxID=152490 RepID=UPI0014738599|nr:hypothetical protein [Helicobacter marmotae]
MIDLHIFRGRRLSFKRFCVICASMGKSKARVPFACTQGLVRSFGFKLTKPANSS